MWVLPYHPSSFVIGYELNWMNDMIPPHIRIYHGDPLRKSGLQSSSAPFHFELIHMDFWTLEEFGDRRYTLLLHPITMIDSETLGFGYYFSWSLPDFRTTEHRIGEGWISTVHVHHQRMVRIDYGLQDFWTFHTQENVTHNLLDLWIPNTQNLRKCVPNNWRSGFTLDFKAFGFLSP